MSAENKENMNLLDVEAKVTITRAYKLPLAKLTVSGALNESAADSKADKVVQRAIIFVIDRSGSMRGERISMVKNALSPFIEAMCDDKYTVIKLILFNNNAETIQVPADKKLVPSTINAKISASGGTNFYEASKGLVNEATQILKQFPSYQLTVIMCSDGEVSKDNAKQGHAHWQHFVNNKYLTVHKTAPYVSTIGISTNHDADVLDGFIVNDQVGNYCKCGRAEQVSDAFERAQNETMCRSTAIKLSIEFPLNVVDHIYNVSDRGHNHKFTVHDLVVTTQDFSADFWVSMDTFDQSQTTAGGDLQLIVNDVKIPIVVNEVKECEECQYEAIGFYNQVLKDMLYTLRNITDGQRLKITAKEIEHELNNKYAKIFKTITAEPAEKVKLQNEIKQLLTVTNIDDDNKSTESGESISKRRAKLMKEYKRMNKHWRKFHAVIKIFQNTLSSLKLLVREIVLGQVRIQEIRQHILDLHFRKKHAKRMEKLILTDQQLTKRQEMYDKIIVPTAEECKNITDGVGTGCYLSTCSFLEVVLDADSLWMCGRINRSGGVAVSNPELIQIEYVSNDLVSDSYFRLALEAASNNNDDEKKMMDPDIGFSDSCRQSINARIFPIYGNMAHFKSSYPYIREILSHTLSGRNDIHVVDYNALWTCLGHMICVNNLTTKNLIRILFEMKPSLKMLSDNIQCKPFKIDSYAREPDINANYLITLAEKKRIRITKFMETFKARTTSWVSEDITLFADKLMNLDIEFNQEFYLSAIMHRLRIMFHLQAPNQMEDVNKIKVDENHRKLLQILICGDGNDDMKEDDGKVSDEMQFKANVYTRKLLKKKKLFEISNALKPAIDFNMKSDDKIIEDWNVDKIKGSTMKLIIDILSRIDIRDLIKGQSFFNTLSNMNYNENDEKINVEKFGEEFTKENHKYNDINKITNDLNLLFKRIKWEINVNVLRAICCVSILFHKNKLYRGNVEWFGDDIKKQIINDPQSVLKYIYSKFVIKNMRSEYKIYIERQNMQKLQEIHTNPLLPDDIDTNGDLPPLRCAWKRCGKTFANRDQLLNHVRFALYGDQRPLLHGFHAHCKEVMTNNQNIKLSKFKKKVRNSFHNTKYYQYIKLPIYDTKMEQYYKQCKSLPTPNKVTN